MNIANVKLAAGMGIMVVAMSSLLVGCSLTSGYVDHQIQTQVQLSHANFSVVKSVVGTAEASYVFGIGPSDQDLIGQAKRDMLNKAQLKGAQAVINVTTDIKHSWFGFWSAETAYVPAEVVEFK